MRNNIQQLRLAVIVTVVVVFVTSCGLFGGDDEEFASPLSDYVGFERLDLNFSTGPDTQALSAGADLERQETIVSCMADQGFEYQVVESTMVSESPVEFKLGSREYAEKYGFGVTTQVFSQAQVGQHLVGYVDVDITPVENPNLAIVNSLDSARRTAYVAALTGKAVTVADDQLMTASALAGSVDAGGCQGQSQEGLVDQSRFYQEFGDDLAVIRQQILTDTRVLEFQEQIGECVAAKGLTYIAPQNLYQHWAPEITAISDSIVFQPATATSGESTTNVLPALSAEAKARLVTIQAEETQLAVAVFGCGGDPAATNALYTELADEYEARFINQNKDRLNAFNDSQ